MSVMTEKINEYKADVAALSGVLPGVAEAYRRFTGACFEPGELDTGTKHLIALGVALFANNEACTYYHAAEALHHGASERQVVEAVAVAAAACGGHALALGVMRLLRMPGKDGAPEYRPAGSMFREPTVSAGTGGQGGRNGESGTANGRANVANAHAWAEEKRYASRPDHASFDAGTLSGMVDEPNADGSGSFPNMEKVSPSF
jgi:AhpD family alkylhydroperoxidase